MKENKKDNRRLTSRQVSIIRSVLECAPNPVTLAAIAERLQTSTRTVLRELNRIEGWMNQNDFTFVRKPGVGLVIEEDAEHIQLMQELLDLEGAQKTFSRKERRR
jgi:mannitol operon transcriptional antiterminator